MTASFTSLVQSLWCAVQKQENFADIESALKIFCAIERKSVWEKSLWQPRMRNELLSTCDRVRQELERHSPIEVVCPRCSAGILTHVGWYPTMNKFHERAKQRPRRGTKPQQMSYYSSPYFEHCFDY